MSGQFQMPPECELFSAVYLVYSPHKFTKSLTVEIQPCAVLSSDKQCTQFAFISTIKNFFTSSDCEKEFTWCLSPFCFSRLGVVTIHTMLNETIFNIQLSPISGCGRAIYQDITSEKMQKWAELLLQWLHTNLVYPCSMKLTW